MRLHPVLTGEDCEATYVEWDEAEPYPPAALSQPSVCSDVSDGRTTPSPSPAFPPSEEEWGEADLHGLWRYQAESLARQRGLEATRLSLRQHPPADAAGIQGSTGGPSSPSPHSPQSPHQRLARFFSASPSHARGGSAAIGSPSPDDPSLRARLFSQDHEVGFNVVHHKHLHGVIPPLPPGGSLRDPVLNSALQQRQLLQGLQEGEADPRYATQHYVDPDAPVGEKVNSPARLGFQRGGGGGGGDGDADAELRRFLGDHVDWGEDASPQRGSGGGGVRLRRQPHPLHGGGGVVPPRLRGGVPAVPRCPPVPQRGVYEPSGLTMRELSRLRPHLARDYLLVDTEGRERGFFEAAEEFCRGEAGARLAVVEAEVRRRAKMRAALNPLHAHIRQRAKLARRDAKVRAQTMKFLQEEYHRPTMEVVTNEVHSQVHGLDALRRQWAQELGVS